MGKKARHVILYGLAMAGIVFGLKWLQWEFLIANNSIDIYIGCIAVFFTILGIWIASQLIEAKKQPAFLQRSHRLDSSKKFDLNRIGLERLNLTEREYQILKLLAQGHSNAAIAEKLFLSLSTIKTHVSNLYSKMNVKSRFEAITLAKQMEIVE